MEKNEENRQEVKRLAGDVNGMTAPIEAMYKFSVELSETMEKFLRDNPIVLNKSIGGPKNTFVEHQKEKISLFNFNDRDMLLKVIEYTRNSSPGYGITAILENFLNDHSDLAHTAKIKIEFKEDA
jgi:hypothetical protein